MPSPTIDRRAVLAAALATALPLPSLAADGFPAKPLTIIVPFSAGGTTDILARIVAQCLHELWGQSVLVENRPGAGGNIAAVAAAKAPADGHTLFMGTVGTHAINASLYKKPGYDHILDFAPLSRVALVPNLLVAHPSQPFNSVQEMMDWARAHPGKLNYGSSGNGTSMHLSGEMFRAMTHLDIVHVPYKGSAPAVADLLGNQIAIMFDNMPSSIPHVRAGKLKPLAVTTAQRSPELPDVPTLDEAGVPGFEATSWFGLFTQAAVPPAVQHSLHQAIQQVLARPDVQEKIRSQGGTPALDSQEAFARFIAAETQKWGEVVKKSGASI